VRTPDLKKRDGRRDSFVVSRSSNYGNNNKNNNTLCADLSAKVMLCLLRGVLLGLLRLHLHWLRQGEVVGGWRCLLLYICVKHRLIWGR